MAIFCYVNSISVICRQAKIGLFLVFKDNLPFNDFIGLPISSKTLKLQCDEIIITNQSLSDGVLPVESKIMLRKVFVISKENPIKKYGALNEKSLIAVKRAFCNYFECSK